MILLQDSSEDMNISSDNEDLSVDDDDDDVHMDIVVDPVDADLDAGEASSIFGRLQPVWHYLWLFLEWFTKVI